MFMVFFGDFDFNFTGGEEFLYYKDFVFQGQFSIFFILFNRVKGGMTLWWNWL